MAQPMAVQYKAIALRVILSRKGFDSSAGGCPSPIIDGRPFPLPIPTRQPTPTTYGDLARDYAAIVSDLTKGRLSVSSPCHLDPDIDIDALPRSPGWRGALGQVEAALSHLDNQGVGVGDLFLFWGSYRTAERRLGRWLFVGPTVHMVYGWLQVGERRQLGADGSSLLTEFPWLADHPHVRPGWGTSNAIFLATDKLTAPEFTGAISGYGTLTRGYQLSEPAGNPSVWRAPEWLHPSMGGSEMSYHPEGRWSLNGTVQTVGRGQEFVANIGDDPRFGRWLDKLMETAR